MTRREKLLEIAEKAIDAELPRADARPGSLAAALRHAVGSGGKRVRPLIALASAVAAGGRAEDAAMPAAAIEFLHNYTLVHDDLPSMDGDVERRGAPTVWKKFGEANGVLAGDALQALAFACAAKTPRNAAGVVAALARAAYGVVCGQVEDVEKSGDTPYIYEHKTADLFIAAAVMGALAAGADAASVAALERFALNLGLAFQYEDDILDGDAPCGSDEAARLAREKTDLALSALDSLPGDTSLLGELATSLLGRKV